MKPSKLIISLKTEAWILDDIQFGNSSQVILHGGDIPKHGSDVFSNVMLVVTLKWAESN